MCHSIECCALSLTRTLWPQPHRHRIEHCQLANPDQLDRIKRIEAWPNFFINHGTQRACADSVGCLALAHHSGCVSLVFYWGERHYERFLGPERAVRINPLASAVERGVRRAGGGCIAYARNV